MILCAWVLWSVLTAPGTPTTWTIHGARETRSDCEALAQQPLPEGREQVGTAVVYQRRTLCLPVGVDPRR